MHFKTQKELNDSYKYPDMDIATKYSYNICGIGSFI